MLLTPSLHREDGNLETQPLLAVQPRFRLRTYTLVLSFAIVTGAGYAASFSAELLDTRNGETRITSFNFHEHSYRFDLVEGGQTLIVTHDGQSGAMRMLVPAEKAYLESGADDVTSRMVDPFACYSYYARKHGVREDGTENVGGVPCTKQVVESGGQLFVTAWWSEEFHFPLKIQTQLDGRTLELRNIQPGPQDSALFALPAGYKLVPGPEEPPPPAWAAQIAQAPLVDLPCERTLSEGNMVRIRPQAGKQVRLVVTNPAKEICALTAIGFKEGRPLGNPSMNTMNLNADDEVTMTFAETPGEADDIVVRAVRATVRVRATWVGADGTQDRDTTPGPIPDSAGEPTPEAARAEISAPAAAAMGSQFEILWSGPANPDDYLAVARPEQPPGANLGIARVREGNPLKLWAPSEPGQYELRYIIARGARVLARRPITVKPVSALVNTTGPVKVADWIEVEWEGPAGDSDFVSVAQPGQPAGAHVSLTRVNQGNPLRVRAPSDPGLYEVRYVLGRGMKLLAKSPITVEPVTATVEAPATATPSADFEVRWTGPGYPEDYVAIARPDQPPGANVGIRRTGQGNPLKLRAPREPGVYEVRYILGRGNRLLAKATVTIAVQAN